MKPTTPDLADVLTEARRLVASTGRLQRRNARRRFQVAVSRLLRAYPCLDADGQPTRAGGQVVLCPLCRVPQRIRMGSGGLRQHLEFYHKLGMTRTPSDARLRAMVAAGGDVLRDTIVAIATDVAMGDKA